MMGRKYEIHLRHVEDAESFDSVIGRAKAVESMNGNAACTSWMKGF